MLNAHASWQTIQRSALCLEGKTLSPDATAPLAFTKIRPETPHFRTFTNSHFYSIGSSLGFGSGCSSKILKASVLLPSALLCAVERCHRPNSRRFPFLRISTVHFSPHRAAALDAPNDLT